MARRACLPLLVVVVVALAGAAALAAKGTIEVPPRSSDGTFEGTWYRVEPGWKQVLQFRRAGGQADAPWEVRLRWQTGAGFDIDTGWQSRTEFTFNGFPGLLLLQPDPARSGDDEVVLGYHREQDGARKMHLVEEGEARVFRAHEGRGLVWLQDPLTTSVVLGEPMYPDEVQDKPRREQRVWIFMKASNRIIEWDEVPW